MKKSNKPAILLIIIFMLHINTLHAQQHADADVLARFHSISSHELYEWVAELASDKYEGRLTGTSGYDAAAEWVAAHFERWGLTPAGDDATWFQWFDIPYTEVFEGCEVKYHIPLKMGEIIKHYTYEDEFIPGATSGSGKITAEVVYAGYGITAPELGYDDYKGIDVKDKIILIEREVPVRADTLPERFAGWRPYSFHQYKLRNAAKHGAAGMLYNYGPIGNPNNAYIEGFIYSHVGAAVVKDMFEGTGHSHRQTVQRIRKTLKPSSFSTGKQVTIKNVTKHHPEGRGANVIGLIKGYDPAYTREAIIVGGHLDHLGHCWEIIPGANDNASAVAVMLALAKSLSNVRLKRPVLFIAFGAEEQAVLGSKVYLENPPVPLTSTLCLINMDGVGAGNKIGASAGKNYPVLWQYIEEANTNWVHQSLRTSYFHNRARPRLDAARFLWAGIPSLSFYAYGMPSHYHTTGDNIEIIRPEIMEDLARILFMAIVRMANETDHLNFRQ